MREVVDLVLTVVGGTVEQLREKLRDPAKRKAAVSGFLPGVGTSLLTNALSNERFDMAEALVKEHGHPVNLPTVDSGFTALHQMCRGGKMRAVQFLVDALGAEVNAKCKDGRIPLHCACERGHVQLVRMLVRTYGSNPNAADVKGSTPLHKACGEGETPTVITLVMELGANPDKADFEGITPLMETISNSHIDTMLALISICGVQVNTSARGITPLHMAFYTGNPVTVNALLAQGADADAQAENGWKPHKFAALKPECRYDKSAVGAALARHSRLQARGEEVLRLSAAWDHGSLQRAIAALMKEADAPWAYSAAVSAASQEYWTAPRHPLDMFRDSKGRTALAVAAAAGIFRNAELLIQAAASPLELDCDGKTPWQLALSNGSELMGVWFESMPIVYWAGHSKLRYRPAATSFLLCCRFSRMRAPAVPPADEAHPIPGVSYMHPDDWCIPRRDVYRILHFVGPELWGSVWPGPPKGYTGPLPGMSPRPVRRVPSVAASAAAAGCAQCGTRAVKLMVCTRCRAASYCSGKCQKLHYPAHKAGCRAAAGAR
jgi:ankyrin repeat protein